MKILYHKDFIKHYKKRIATNPQLLSKFRLQLNAFSKNPSNPTLKDHKLIGKKNNYRAFSITGDIRVVYKIVDDTIWFYDVGTHNQVY
jgi:addiction module RelE/StbE family toxin